MQIVRSSGINKWSEDDNTLLTNNLLWAAVLLSPSIIVFGDKSEKKHDPAKLLKIEWVKEDTTEKSIDLSHLQPGLRDDIVSRYEGAVFLITGPDLRLRTRAYPGGFTDADFPDITIPKGRFFLRSEAGFRDRTYRWLMDQVKQLERENKR